MIEVDDVHDLFETLELLGSARRPGGRRIGAVSESGGECALLADHAEAAGMPFAPLPSELAAQLRAEPVGSARPATIRGRARLQVR